MRLSAARIKQLCTQDGHTLQALLQQAGVSRTAYYSMVRRPSVLPGSVRAIAGALGVKPSVILEEPGPAERRAWVLLREAKRILARHPHASFENVWHTLVLLDDRPVERLRRSLLRGRRIDLH
jgi:lambda repressor-like predicted transcriptional regulator